jgi:selenocysteine-specific translation elongation factor
MAGQLSNFKRVVVVASSRDKYVSWHSARIENFNKDVLKQYTFIENEMICNILGKGSGIERIDRLEVDFKIS